MTDSAGGPGLTVGDPASVSSTRDAQLAEQRTSAPQSVSESAIKYHQLDHSLVSGLAWLGGMRGFSRAIQWSSTLLVVRMLQPSDYGLVGMALAYTGFVRVINEIGLGSAIIQRRGLSEDQVARLGGASILLSAVLFALSLLLAPLVAAFFREPIVARLIVVMAVTLPIGGHAVLSTSLMKRDLEFDRLALVQGAESLALAVSTLTLAAFGFGYWALVVGMVIGRSANAIAASRLHPHPVAWPAPIRTIAPELWFGWHVILSRIALYVRSYADVTVVGRVLGKSALGAYNIAWTVANIPVDRMTSLANDVSPSILAAVQNDPAALRRYLRIFNESVALLAFPATIGLALVAEDFVLVVLGDQWSGAIAVLQILAFTAAMRSITPVLSQVLIATDKAKLNMQFSVAAAVLLPPLFYLGSRWGMTGVALAWLIGHPLVVTPILLRHALRSIDMSLREYGATLRPATVAMAIMAASVLTLRMLLPSDLPFVVRLSLEVTVGLLTYGAAAYPAYRHRLAAFRTLTRGSRTAAVRAIRQQARQ